VKREIRNSTGNLIAAETMACFLCRRIRHAARIWFVLARVPSPWSMERWFCVPMTDRWLTARSRTLVRLSVQL